MVTTEAIVHAITSPTPKTRYFMGSAGAMPGWYVARLKWLMPDRMWDLLTIHLEAIDAMMGA